MLAIVLLVLHAVGSWTYEALGPTAAVVSAVFVGAISLFSARVAHGRGSHAWFVVPAALFTTIPLAARLWTLFTGEETGWARAAEFTPFLIGFAAPVLLLLMAYIELGRRQPAHGPQ
jgi:hypothetical protein